VSAARLRAVAMYAAATLILCYMLAPLLLVFPMSLTSGNTLQYPVPGYSLRWYEELIVDRRWIAALKVSLIVAITSTALALALGIPAALALAWGSFPGKRIVSALLAAPIVTPIVIVGVASYFFFSRMGLVGDRLSIALVHAAIALPVVVATVAASLATFDRTLLRASASLGAGAWRGFFEILLPLIAPGVAAGAIIAFIISFDEVVVASFLSVGADRTLPRMIFSGVRESVSPAVAAVSVVLMTFSAVLLALLSWVQARAARGRKRAGGRDE
jgi:putative spermidine/putrescine transport system permease protein